MAETMNTTEMTKEEALITAGFRKRTNDENADVYKIFSILYGLVIFVGGVAFSISHAIVQGEEGEIIRHFAKIYFTYLYWVSIIWMIFCMIDIVRHRRKVNIPRGNLNRLDSNHTGLIGDVRLARNELISTSIEAKRKSSTTTYIDLQVFDESKEDQLDNNEDKRPEINLNELSTDNEDTLSFHDHRSKSNSLENLSRQSSATKSPTDMTRGAWTRRRALGPTQQRDLRTYVRQRRNSIVQHVIGYNYDDNSTVGGLYTRIGIGIFCLGTVIHSGLSILSNLENRSCVRWTLVMDHSSRLLFSFIQFFFIFKHSNLIIRAHESLARLAVIHIVVTNLCVWFRMVVIETHSQIGEMGSHQHNNASSHLNNGSGNTNDLLHHQLIPHLKCSPVTLSIHQGYMQLKPLLYPCTIEFSLMCLTLFFVIWENIGKTFTHKISDKASTKNVFMVNCHASIKGLFAGMIVFSCTIISIILYAVFQKKTDDASHWTSSSLVDMHRDHSHPILARTTTTTTTIFNRTYSMSSIIPAPITDVYRPFTSASKTTKSIYNSIAILEIINLCVLALSLCATVWSLIKIRKLNYRRTTTRFDDVLIIVSLTGIYLYSIFSAFAIISNLSSSTWIAYIRLATIILEFVEGTIHALFILVALRKRLGRTSQHKYPAREMITLLIMLDLSLWVERTTTTTKHEANPFQLAFYQVIPWSIIAAIATPLQIFFRFHASVCLSNVWGHIYNLPVYKPVAPSDL